MELGKKADEAGSGAESGRGEGGQEPGGSAAGKTELGCVQSGENVTEEKEGAKEGEK